MSKEELIKQLPIYKSHEFDGVRWFIEFVPPPWLDGEGAVINDEFFEKDYNNLMRVRKLLVEARQTN